MNEKEKQEWHAITVTVPKEGSEWISHLLFELGSVGNLEEDGPDPALIAMKGYFPAELGASTAIIQQINELMRGRGIEPLSTYSATIKIQNWAEQAKQLFSPIKILDDVTIINPWSDYQASEGEETVIINPGMAFGTGFHATTKLAARLMAETITKEGIKKVCDIGSGSGILSIIAAKKGAGKIDAVEIDTDARRSALENIEANRCKTKIDLFEKVDQITSKYDLVVANILFSIILELKDKLIESVAKDGFLVISGITEEEDERFREAYRDAYGDQRLILVKNELLDGWMGYKFKSKIQDPRSKTNPKLKAQR